MTAPPLPVQVLLASEGWKVHQRPWEFGTSATRLRKSGSQDGSFQGNCVSFFSFFSPPFFPTVFAPILKCRLACARQSRGCLCCSRAGVRNGWLSGESVSSAACEETGRRDEWKAVVSVEECAVIFSFIFHWDGRAVHLVSLLRPFSVADRQHDGANTLRPLDRMNINANSLGKLACLSCRNCPAQPWKPSCKYSSASALMSGSRQLFQRLRKKPFGAIFFFFNFISYKIQLWPKTHSGLFPSVYWIIIIIMLIIILYKSERHYLTLETLENTLPKETEASKHNEFK